MSASAELGRQASEDIFFADTTTFREAHTMAKLAQGFDDVHVHILDPTDGSEAYEVARILNEREARTYERMGITGHVGQHSGLDIFSQAQAEQDSGGQVCAFVSVTARADSNGISPAFDAYDAEVKRVWAQHRYNLEGALIRTNPRRGLLASALGYIGIKV